MISPPAHHHSPLPPSAHLPSGTLSPRAMWSRVVYFVVVVCTIADLGFGYFGANGNAIFAKSTTTAVAQPKTIFAQPSSFDEELVVICIGDSITFGNGSHGTRRKSATAKFQGSYPRELGRLFQDRIGISNKGEQESKFDGRLLVYNFGVSGATAMTNANHAELAFDRKPEFNASMAVLKDALSFGTKAAAAADDGVGDLDAKPSLTYSLKEILSRNPSFHQDNFMNKQTEAILKSTSGRSRVRNAVRRKIIVLFMLGTNDSKGSVWSNADGFVNDYTKLVDRLLLQPASQSKRFQSPKSDESLGDAPSDKRDSVELSAVFLTPVAALPQPFPTADKKLPRTRNLLGEKKPPIVFDIRGLTIATDVRHGVLETVSRIRAKTRSLNISVHFYDLFSDFLSFIASQHDNEVKSEGTLTSPSSSSFLALFPRIPDQAKGGEIIRNFVCPKISPDLFPEGEKSYISLCRRHFFDAQVRAALFDGVHPSPAGHAHMARLIYDWLENGFI